MTRALRVMTNLFCGAMSFAALGSPVWFAGGHESRKVPGICTDPGLSSPLPGFAERPGLRPAAREAISTYIGGLRRLTRDSSTFAGLSGGRTKVMQEVVNFRRTYAQEVLDSSRLVSMMSPGAEDAAERPGAQVLPFVADRLCSSGGRGGPRNAGTHPA